MHVIALLLWLVASIVYLLLLIKCVTLKVTPEYQRRLKNGRRVVFWLFFVASLNVIGLIWIEGPRSLVFWGVSFVLSSVILIIGVGSHWWFPVILPGVPEIEITRVVVVQEQSKENT